MMPLFRRQLLATAASLSFVFGSAAFAQGQTQKTPAPPPGLQTITAQYHTKDSKDLAALEKRLNDEKPKGAPRIVFIDPDVMATWLQIKGSLQAYGDMTAEYLTAKKVNLTPEAISTVAALSASMTPAAALSNPPAGGDFSQAACVITPYNPNMPAEIFMRDAVTLNDPATGQTTDAAPGMKFSLDISRAQMEEIIDAREAWSCFDPGLVAQLGKTTGFDQVMARHRLEVFSDVGGLMQAVKDGADPSLIGKFADFRESAAAVTMRPRAGVFAPGTENFYGSIIHDTGPALADLQARIEKMGLDKFRKLSGDEMKQLAQDITAKSALQPDEATHIMGFAMLGADYFRTLEFVKADPAAVAAAKQAVEAAAAREEAAVNRSFREMTDDEIEASQVPRVNPLFTYEFLQENIFSDPAVNKDPNDAKARLHVHEEIVDKVRALMDAHPGEAGVIRQVLQGVFLSNPLMEKAPPPQPQGPPPRLVVA